MPTKVMTLKDLHHHGGEAMKIVRAGDSVVFYNEKRGMVEAVLRPPTAAEREAINAQLAEETEAEAETCTSD